MFLFASNLVSQSATYRIFFPLIIVVFMLFHGEVWLEHTMVYLISLMHQAVSFNFEQYAQSYDSEL